MVSLKILGLRNFWLDPEFLQVFTRSLITQVPQPCPNRIKKTIMIYIYTTLYFTSPGCLCYNGKSLFEKLPKDRSEKRK